LPTHLVLLLLAERLSLQFNRCQLWIASLQPLHDRIGSQRQRGIFFSEPVLVEALVTEA
jgi:hypothetical protein